MPCHTLNGVEWPVWQRNDFMNLSVQLLITLRRNPTEFCAARFMHSVTPRTLVTFSVPFLYSSHREDVHFSSLTKHTERCCRGQRRARSDARSEPCTGSSGFLSELRQICRAHSPNRFLFVFSNAYFLLLSSLFLFGSLQCTAPLAASWMHL